MPSPCGDSACPDADVIVNVDVDAVAGAVNVDVDDSAGSVGSVGSAVTEKTRMPSRQHASSPSLEPKLLLTSVRVPSAYTRIPSLLFAISECLIFYNSVFFV